MKELSTSYTPISCDYYDLLEIAAMHKQESDFEYWDEKGQKQSTRACIEELYAREGREFLLLSNGTCFRLDQLIRMDTHEVPLPGSNGNACSMK